MGLIKSVLIILVPAFLFLFAGLNGFLGRPIQEQMENFILTVMGDSRGSYFLKNMTPLKDTPLREHTNRLVDQGQAAYASGRKKGDELLGSAGQTTERFGGSVNNVLDGSDGRGL